MPPAAQEKEELESQRLTEWGFKKCTWNVLLMLRRGRSRTSSRSRTRSRRRRTRTDYYRLVIMSSREL